MNPATNDTEKKQHYKGPRSPQGRDQAMRKKGRLPHRSQFLCQYDDASQSWTGSWTGSLTVPVPGPGGVETTIVFTGTWKGLFGLEAMLDDRYRDWARAVADGTVCSCDREPGTDVARLRGLACVACGCVVGARGGA